jgi:hypothetical protein
MIRIFFILLLLSFSTVTYNQTIIGTVCNNDTKAIINFSSVYFNGTVTGTLTDSKGNYEPDISKHSSTPLTISAIEYYSAILTDLSPSKPFIIFLTPKVFELNEIVISSKGYDRERKSNLKLSKTEFLGPIVNASECKILNEDDIKFLYDSEGDIFTAFSSEPDISENKALGYIMEYYPDKFEYNTKTETFLFRGNTILNERLSPENMLKQLLIRQSAYVGSGIHFFKTLRRTYNVL